MKCDCGCGHEVVHKHKAARFAPHHTAKEKVKLRYRIAKRNACEGIAVPDDWALCEVCGEWFPVFYKLHGVEFSIRSCPDFINPECGPALRGKCVAGSDSRGSREESKDFRAEICTRLGKNCEDYSRCSDREFSANPKDRLWEYEKYGVNCYK